MIISQGDLPNQQRHYKRVVCLVPSLTELLYNLDMVPIAQTIFCVHPTTEFKSSIKIGGTKKVNISKTISLSPDLIIANKEENEKDQIIQLSEHVDVYLTDIKTIQDSVEMIIELGSLIGRTAQSLKLAQTVKQGFNSVKITHSKSCLYLIWKDPYMAAGKQTFINAILEKCGYKNVLKEDSRYPEISAQSIKNYNPEAILLSSEPYPFRDIHLKELQSILPNTDIKLVDGELYSWYGSRLLKTLNMLQNL